MTDSPPFSLHPRIVHCEDAVSWLQKSPVIEDASFVASLPDISEFPSYTLEKWKEWFISTATLILSRTPDEGVTIFYQSDIKHEGAWVDKSYLCQKAAEAKGHTLIWHKIICRSAPGQATYGRPSYSHMVCFSKRVTADPHQSGIDVLPETGEKTWERGTGLSAAMLIARFVAKHTKTHTLVNPFCGQGSIIAAADAIGLSTIGIERNAKRAQNARDLKVDIAANKFILPGK